MRIYLPIPFVFALASLGIANPHPILTFSLSSLSE